MKARILMVVIFSMSLFFSIAMAVEKDNTQSQESYPPSKTQEVNTSRMKLKDVMPPSSDKSTMEKLDDKRTIKTDRNNPEMDIKIGPIYSK